ncbi:DUF1707 domain-containing protein [Pseudonocardia sp. KRD291]|uniref:DUF1707 domain-containing protein n=1 Tax=Pseudonocardia sp. KRD291 TaxID=2792007 RepID=UPI001C4A1CCF|nr:DUF1707 domain-containing protein [Pseudonocardia sp. KRD291]MBW0103917.1 DUF1707 domain-containing protein [Pseudonocardia sp. KRD291]
MSSGQPDGIGYAEQEEAVRALSQHYTAGRLDVDEFDERVRRARASSTGAELGAVFADLPEPRPSAVDRPVPPGVDDATRATASDPSTGGPTVVGSTEDTVATPQYPGAAAQFPDSTRQYPAPGQQPGGPYPDQQYWGPPPRFDTSGTPYPGASPYPGAQYPGQQYPGQQYPDGPHPGGHDHYGAPQYGGQPYGPQQYGAQPYGNQRYAAPYPPPGAPYGMPPGGYDPAAPYGWDPLTGRPYSDKQKIVAGLLSIFLPFGVGRFYTGHVGIGIAQLLVTFLTFGIGAIWPFIDGIIVLAGSPTDPEGRPLRP